MSTTATRSYDEALLAATRFRDLFDGTYERWEFAGSLRRGRRDIHDTEHVVIPKVANAPGGDLFATPEPRNLLWHRLDELVTQGRLTRHLYSNGYRWGPKYRGVDETVAGAIVMNELFCATPDNWGPTLAIRTGPADFSRRLVTGLRHRHYRNEDGYVWRCQPCPDLMKREHPGELCKLCQGTGLHPVEKLSVPDELQYFALCGVAWAQPEARR